MLQYKRVFKTVVKPFFLKKVVPMVSVISSLLGSDLWSFPVGRDVVYWG